LRVVRSRGERHDPAAVIRAANARVVIFPELSMTGYELDADAISVDD
jgi:predicted amidohydrolase